MGGEDGRGERNGDIHRPVDHIQVDPPHFLFFCSATKSFQGVGVGGVQKNVT